MVRFCTISNVESDMQSLMILQFIEEAERSLHDAIMIVRRAMKNSTVVAGGGAIDVGFVLISELSVKLRMLFS